jgi:hypothetical protein
MIAAPDAAHFLWYVCTVCESVVRVKCIYVCSIIIAIFVRINVRAGEFHYDLMPIKPEHHHLHDSTEAASCTPINHWWLRCITIKHETRHWILKNDIFKHTIKIICSKGILRVNLLHNLSPHSIYAVLDRLGQPYKHKTPQGGST